MPPLLLVFPMDYLARGTVSHSSCLAGSYTYYGEVRIMKTSLSRHTKMAFCMGFLEAALFELPRSHCHSISGSHYSHDWSEQLVSRTDFFTFPKEKEVCLLPFYMKHNYGLNLMPVTFEQGSLMSMPSYGLVHTPSRI